MYKTRTSILSWWQDVLFALILLAIGLSCLASGAPVMSKNRLIPDLIARCNPAPLPLANGAIVAGDFNSDGFSDFVMCGSYSIFGPNTYPAMGTSQSDFLYASSLDYLSLPVFVGSCALTTHQLFDDGRDGFLLSGQASGGTPSVVLFRQTTANQMDAFNPNLFYPPMSGLYQSCSATGDLTGDALKDIVLFGNNGTNYDAQLYLQNANRTFTEIPSSLYIGGVPPGVLNCGVEVYDANGDNRSDLWFTGDVFLSAVHRVYLQNANGTLSSTSGAQLGSGVTLPTGGDSSLAVGDLNSDGLQDISWMGGNLFGPDFEIYYRFSNGSMRVSAASDYTGAAPLGTSGGALVVGDMDGNSRDDILYTGAGLNETLVYLQLQNHTLILATPAFFTGEPPFGSAASSLLASDLDGDGLDD